MTDPRQEAFDLIAAYSVDALEGDEVRRAEAALAADRALRDELDEHRALLATLAEAVDPFPSTPSPRVWESITNAIDGAQEVSPKLASIHDIRTQQRFTKWTAVLSLAAIAMAVMLGISVIQLQRARQTPAVDIAIQELLDDPTAVVATLSAVEGNGTEARIVLGADGVGYLYADNLPPLDPSRTYQLWAIIDDRVISAGVLGHDPDDSPFQVVGAVGGFAITEEIAGGVPVSEGETVAVWLANT